MQSDGSHTHTLIDNICSYLNENNFLSDDLFRLLARSKEADDSLEVLFDELVKIMKISPNVMGCCVSLSFLLDVFKPKSQQSIILFDIGMERLQRLKNDMNSIERYDNEVNLVLLLARLVPSANSPERRLQLKAIVKGMTGLPLNPVLVNDFKRIQAVL